MSGGLTVVREAGVTHVETDDGQNSSVLSVFDCQLSGRFMYSASPCRVLVPDLLTMFIAGPAVHPNSAENELERICTSCTAPSGSVVIAVWRPHPSSMLAPSSMYVFVRRLPPAVTKYVAFTNKSPVPLPWRNAELNSGKVLTFRPRIGVSSIVTLSSRRPICGSARTPA